MKSSVRNVLDFHPQLWLTANTSGELLKRVCDVPVALAQLMAKYADTAGRGSRYGCCGADTASVDGMLNASDEGEGEGGVGEGGDAERAWFGLAEGVPLRTMGEAIFFGDDGGLYRSEGVAGDARDQVDLAARAGGGDRLVRALAAGAEGEALAQDRLAHAGQADGAVGGVGDEDAEDDDAVLPPHLNPPRHASGGITPSRSATQP